MGAVKYRAPLRCSILHCNTVLIRSGDGDGVETEVTCECDAPDTCPVIVPEAPIRLQIVLIIITSVTQASLGTTCDTGFAGHH